MSPGNPWDFPGTIEAKHQRPADIRGQGLKQIIEVRLVAVGFLTSNQVDILHETSEILEAGLSVLHLILCGAGISFVSFCINND